MKNIAFAFFALCLSAHAATYTIAAGASAASITSTANAASASTGNTVSFPAGTWNLASGVTLPCLNGTIYTGPVPTFTPGIGVSPTAILNATFTGGNAVTIRGNTGYTVPGSGCTIQGLSIANQNVYVAPPTSGLLFALNKVYNIVGSLKGSGNTTSWAGVYVSDGTNQDIGYSSFLSNTFGPSCTDVDASITTDYNGTCGGIIIQGSNVNVTVQGNNVSGQVEEFFHALGQGTGGQISKNLLIQNNDMGGVHRIGVELQQGTVSGAIVRYNSLHDYTNPTPFSFGLSLACCFAPNSTAPGVVVTGNLIIANTACAAGYCYGYGIEAWGNQSQFTNNVIQTTASAKFANAISVGGASGALSTTPAVTGNLVQGYSPAVVCEQGGTFPNCTYVNGAVVNSNNLVFAIASAIASSAPSVTLSGPLASIAEAAANTSAYYTTDGSTPAPGQGTTKLYSAPVIVPSGGTIKAVGMWGAGANPYSYATGFGYIPSAVQSATYISTITPPPPVVTPVTTTFKPGYTATIGADGTLTVTQ